MCRENVRWEEFEVDWYSNISKKNQIWNIWKESNVNNFIFYISPSSTINCRISLSLAVLSFDKQLLWKKRSFAEPFDALKGSVFYPMAEPQKNGSEQVKKIS
jgi:hypothetical protein